MNALQIGTATEVILNDTDFIWCLCGGLLTQSFLLPIITRSVIAGRAQIIVKAIIVYWVVHYHIRENIVDSGHTFLFKKQDRRCLSGRAK